MQPGQAGKPIIHLAGLNIVDRLEGKHSFETGAIKCETARKLSCLAGTTLHMQLLRGSRKHLDILRKLRMLSRTALTAWAGSSNNPMDSSSNSSLHSSPSMGLGRLLRIHRRVVMDISSSHHPQQLPCQSAQQVPTWGALMW
jgi:hypothetical protein